MMNKIILTLSLAIAVLVAGCKDNESTNYPVEIRMTDAPGPYEAVMIDLKNIEINVQDGDNGWTSLNTRPGIYDLMKLTNGIDTMIANGNIPAGKISQIRLILGPNNSVKIDGKTHELETPSAQQSGLKLQVHTTLTEGITYMILLDFDASRSIVERGNGKYSLKPVIRTITSATSGAIKGKADPSASMPSVYAVMGTDTAGTTADSTGAFMLRGLAAGTYNVVFVPKTPYLTKTVPGVGVTVGSVTDMGTVTIVR